MPYVHCIAPGECVVSLAVDHGFAPATIWDHPANAGLREERRNMHVLEPGDEVVIPDLRPGIVACETGRRHRFRRRGVPQRLSMQLLVDDQPRAAVPYRLVVDGTKHEGVTDTEGRLSHWIPPNAHRGVLLVEGEAYDLEFGHLDPATTRAGFRARLVNLGFLASDSDDAAAFELAVIRFKRRYCGLVVPPSGFDAVRRAELAAIDARTIDAIERAHGS